MTDQTPPKKKAAAKKRVPAITVRTAKPKSHFRRAGLDFTNDVLTIAIADITDEQLEALRAEPMLVVEDTEIEA